MARKPGLLQLYSVARAYYIENKDQDEIAAGIGLSRSQVSRLLDQARKSGIVRFDVRLPSDLEGEALAESLRDLLSIESVRIAPASSRPEQQSEALTSYAATVIPELVAGSALIGVGWGRTIYDLTLKMGSREPIQGRRIVPLVGSAGQQAPWLQINGIVDRLAEKLQAERVFIRMQAFIEAGNAPPSRMEEENLDYMAALWNEVETAVIGLGMPANRAAYLQSEIDGPLLRILEKSSSVGDILGRFFGAEGREIEPGSGWRLVSLGLERLKAMRTVICVCRGVEKLDGIVAAARSGFFKTLITDVATAEALLARSSP
ncbi:MAG: sugar-binding domain-containing protein [Spirochaetota bacterium]